MLSQYTPPNDDDFEVEGLLERICEQYKLDPNNLPTDPSAMAQMLKANGYEEDAEFDEEELDREYFDNDESYDQAHSDFQNRKSEWENHYYLSIRWQQNELGVNHAENEPS